MKLKVNNETNAVTSASFKLHKEALSVIINTEQKWLNPSVLKWHPKRNSWTFGPDSVIIKTESNRDIELLNGKMFYREEKNKEHFVFLTEEILKETGE